MTEPRTLPPFPVDPETLSLLAVAVNPWAHDVQAECSSLGSFLEFMSQLGGSDTEATHEAELDDGVASVSEPQYSPNDVIEALVDEISRLRAEPARVEETLEEVKERIGWHATIWDVLLLTLVITGIIAVVANA